MQATDLPFGKLVLNLIIVAVGVALFAGLLRLVVADPQHSHYVEEYSAKLSSLEESEPNLVFVGSSHVNRGVDPRVFDRTAASLGWQVRSFNLALSDMKPAEEQRVVERLFAESKHIDYLVFEPTFVAQLRWDNITHTRSLYFNDAAGLQAAAHFNASSDRSKAAVAYGMVTHGLAFVVGSAGYGVTSGRLFPHRNDALDQLIADNRGFIPTDDDPRLKQKERQAERTRERMLAKMRDLFPSLEASSLSQVEPLASTWVDAFVDVARVAESHGAKVVFAFPPILGVQKRAMQFARAMQDRGQPVLIYVDTQRTPELWDFALWRDAAHFNQRGAEVFSRRFAQDVWTALGRPTGGSHAVQ